MIKSAKYLPYLHTFLIAAQQSSYSKAAQMLCISQAAVSQQMRTLEAHLQQTLFYRSGRNMKLTEAGQLLANQCQPAIEQIHLAIEQLSPQPIAGELRVSSSPSFASRWLMPRMWRFSLRYPEISIQLLTSSRLMSADSRQQLGTGEIDIEICLKTEDTRNLDEHILFSGEVYPVAPPSIGNFDGNTTKLLNYWLVERENEKTFSWENWFKAQGIDMCLANPSQLQVISLDNALSAVTAGHGLCFGVHQLVQDLIHKGELIRAHEHAFNQPLTFAAYHRQQTRKQERIRCFLSWIAEEVNIQAGNFEDQLALSSALTSK